MCLAAPTWLSNQSINQSINRSTDYRWDWWASKSSKWSRAI